MVITVSQVLPRATHRLRWLPVDRVILLTHYYDLPYRDHDRTVYCWHLGWRLQSAASAVREAVASTFVAICCMGGHAVPEELYVSFVVIAYNEEANIARTLTAISQLEGLGNYEVIVVDDGSRDSTGQIVSDIAMQNPCIHLIGLVDNRGRGFARSRAVAAARGELIATVDADIILPANWLTRTSAALERHDAVGGIAVPDGDVAFICKRFKLLPRIVHGTTTVAGSNGLYRREVFDVVTFDPALREGEDSALNHAMDRQGLSCATVPGLLVQHEESKSLGTSLKWLFDTGRGATRQLLTYRNVRQPDLVAAAFMSAVALGTFLAVRKHRFVGAAIPVGFVLAASAQHVRSRFETPRSHWRRLAPAVAVDSAMLTAYFAGRLVGLSTLWRRRDLAVPALAGRDDHFGPRKAKTRMS
jgi:glycosyltransferase involved in cell wall biosynthesis